MTLQVRNSPDLVAEAQLTVNVKDENNQSPIFTNVESGNVLEHEKAGTPVMTVSAVDNDGTYPNSRVSSYPYIALTYFTFEKWMIFVWNIYFCSRLL